MYERRPRGSNAVIEDTGTFQVSCGPLGPPELRNRTIPQPDQRRATGKEIGERVLVEHPEKRAPRVLKDALQSTRGIDRTGVRRAVEALDQIEVRLGEPHDSSNVDVAGGTVQAKAAAASPHARDEIQ